MNRPQPTRRTATVPTGETSMRILEYAVCLVAAVAAVLLGSIH